MIINTSLNFRAITSSDTEQLYELLNSLSGETKHFFHPHPFDKTTLKDICSIKKDRYYVMLLEEKIIGYSMLRLFDTNIPSFGCCIHPDYIGKGYGEKITLLTLEQAKKNEYSTIILKVNKDNKSAISLYEKIGFKKIDDEKNEITMSINL